MGVTWIGRVEGLRLVCGDLDFGLGMRKFGNFYLAGVMDNYFSSWAVVLGKKLYRNQDPCR